MERDLIKFNKNTNIISKDIAEYKDEKGNLRLFSPSQLLCSVEYMELDELQYKKALFEMIIDKNIKYNKITITKPIDKYSKTKNEKDKGTIIDGEVEVSQVWLVRNMLGISKAYDNKEKAIEYAKGLNEEILKMAELK